MQWALQRLIVDKTGETIFGDKWLLFASARQATKINRKTGSAFSHALVSIFRPPPI